MTQLIAEPARVQFDASAGLIVAASLSLVVGLVGTWSFWRVRTLLGSFSILEERMTAVSNAVALLTDTTEACFKAMAIELEAMRQPLERSGPRRASHAVPPVAASRRKQRRRIVGAARRGEPVSRIAAREELAEGEVALRLQVHAREEAGKRNGNLLS